jgi:hypothetical protein
MASASFKKIKITMYKALKNITLNFILILLITNYATAQNWYRGNLHTHSLWSDGNNYPEIIAEWYKERGYNFLGLTEHNLMQDTEKWVAISPGAIKRKEIFGNYLSKYGEEWLDAKRFDNDSIRVRLKKLEEYQNRFNEEGKFLLINSEEITSSYNNLPVHVNGINMEKVIPKQPGNSNTEVLQHVADAVLGQEKATGKNMLFFIDHPNFGPTLTADDIMNVKNATLFELFNAGTSNNYGDSTHDNTELIWDKVNVHHTSADQPLMYGIATDDMHDLQSQAARAWVMVNAPTLAPEAIVTSIEAGNFYASTGVVLEEIHAEKGKISFTIKKQDSITYKIQFIGVKKGKNLPEIFSETTGTSATYKLKKDDLFVRAKITSSKLHFNPHKKGDTEVAWVQPIKN